jgi:hypothetical protein
MYRSVTWPAVARQPGPQPPNQTGQASHALTVPCPAATRRAATDLAQSMPRQPRLGKPCNTTHSGPLRTTPQQPSSAAACPITPRRYVSRHAKPAVPSNTEPDQTKARLSVPYPNPYRRAGPAPARIAPTTPNQSPLPCRACLTAAINPPSTGQDLPYHANRPRHVPPTLAISTPFHTRPHRPHPDQPVAPGQGRLSTPCQPNPTTPSKTDPAELHHASHAILA